MYEDIMTPGTAVTAPSGHQPPPTTWLQLLARADTGKHKVVWGIFSSGGAGKGQGAQVVGTLQLDT